MEARNSPGATSSPIPVDTQGFLLAVVVHPANVPASLTGKGAKLVLQVMGAAFPHFQRIWADQGSTGALIA